LVNAKTWKAWLAPGGLVLALTAALVDSSLFVQIAPSLGFYYGGVFLAGLLLAWRFNSSRVLFSLITLLLAHRAVEFYSASSGTPAQTSLVFTASGHTAVLLAALLIPANFIAFAAMRERGLIVAGIAPRFGLLLLESVVFAVLCRPENNPVNPHRSGDATMPLWVLLSFLAAIAFFIWRFFRTRKPIEPGLVWATLAVLIWLEFAPVGRASVVYVATAALILAASLIETSYVLAYHDELTGIRGRRAFNECLLSLDQQYAIAIADIDHFKKFNDTYGHDVGDHVLCMVAARLSKVGGDGQAFRCGGEEFAIVFRNTSAKEAFDHLEALRQAIEKSSFQVRGSDRRANRRAETVAATRSDGREDTGNDLRTRETDRRRSRNRNATFAIQNPPRDRLSVTVSIGVAEPSTRYRQPEQVIQAADQALYRAKHKGRNRVELASTAPLRLARGKRAQGSRL
jgi:diguanylate cyclase (GGDEF)-like protein